MRGTKAKKIRREIYGDFAFHAPRRYGRSEKGTIVLWPKDGASVRRRAYKVAKRRAA